MGPKRDDFREFIQHLQASCQQSLTIVISSSKGYLPELKIISDMHYLGPLTPDQSVNLFI